MMWSIFETIKVFGNAPFCALGMKADNTTTALIASWGVPSALPYLSYKGRHFHNLDAVEVFKVEQMGIA